MKKDWQESFWREVSDGKFDNSQQLEQHVIEKITLARKERHVSRKGGEYLPLSRWRTLGYDTDAVAANSDKKWNAGLKCLCYRVCIESQYDENIEEAVREELHSRSRRKTPSRSPTGGAIPLSSATAGDKVKKDSKEAATANDQKEKSRSRSKACSDKKGRSKEAAAAGDRKNNRSRSRKAERSSSEKRGGSSSKKRGRSSSKKRGRSSSKKRGRSSSMKSGRSRSQKKNDKDRSRSKKKERSSSKNKGRSRSRRNKGRSKSRRGRSRHPG